MNKSVKILIAIGATAILLVALLGAVYISPIGTGLAATLNGDRPAAWAGAWHGRPWGSGSGFTLPSALQGLTSIPADQRFAHFEGVQVNLKDQNGQPLSIHIIPGKVTAASATSLSIQANDGSSQTFTLNDQTLIHSQSANAAKATGTPAPQTSLANGDDVIVITFSDSTTATAVIDGGPTGFNWSRSSGW